MTQTRLNDDQQVEVLIESVEGYALMVAPVQAEDGYLVRLNPQQLELLNQLVEAVQAVSVNVENNSGTANLAALVTSLNQIRTQDLSVIKQALLPIENLTGLSVALQEISGKLDNISQAIGDINQSSAIVAANPVIESLMFPAADHQYEYTFPAGTTRYAFSCRGDAARNDIAGNVRFAWEINKVAPAGGGLGVDDYEVLLPENEEYADQFFEVAQKIYFAAEVAGTVINIRRWSNAAI